MRKRFYGLFFTLLLVVSLFVTLAATSNNHLVQAAVSIAASPTTQLMGPLQAILNILQNKISPDVTATKDKVNALQPISMTINKTVIISPTGEETIDVLPFTKNVAYVGHLTLALFGSAFNTLYVRGYVLTNETSTVIGTADFTSGTSNQINIDFVCQKMDFKIINSYTLSEPAIVFGMIDYTVCTNVTSLP